MTWSRIDPRYLVLLFLISFVLAGQLLLGFFQQWDSLFVSVGTSVTAELVLVRLLRGRWTPPLSALITGLGISLLLSSYLLWPYVLASLLAIIIKHAVRLRGKHVFNPNNVAMCMMLYFLPQYAVSTPKQWTNGYEVMAFILLLGAIAAYSAGRLDTVLAFILGFAWFALIRCYVFDEPLLYAFGPMLGASFQLFSFFMITDPQTTPPTRMARVVFAFCIAGLDAWLRIQEITNSTFYSAFLVALLIGLPYRVYKGRNRIRPVSIAEREESQ
ncbi:NQR2/RnfD/RnfE family subunit of NADH-ubiquinone oxidoreductase [Paenibacillus cellulosilyticus]|uniref:NQR2/RnfD/RnfE family subunit of NADH-ubiquinone oxidoreductase n=1 Tax=Paenibacillus cellulosilyticus TaxID=375489 RepID=A0A2V2YY35_9BACL|nr:RnfABCDGE type electron transport complex subunit D [Paenibacillus cellulosilyticus]PWW03243.1 NQR2/RnfD/RnfE family subunit of NADH-ubiquinone oxidoreductase [Paenibacillus cellulosilyticus]QKS43729.1 RnfABCDGE type electron transport complex subunit D [Paenibacillus cellulosilyticus]